LTLGSRRWPVCRRFAGASWQIDHRRALDVDVGRSTPFGRRGVFAYQRRPPVDVLRPVARGARHGDGSGGNCRSVARKRRRDGGGKRERRCRPEASWGRRMWDAAAALSPGSVVGATDLGCSDAVSPGSVVRVTDVGCSSGAVARKRRGGDGNGMQRGGVARKRRGGGGFGMQRCGVARKRRRGDGGGKCERRCAACQDFLGTFLRESLRQPPRCPVRVVC
jgi:hypothetical protein